jgi:uncharacterized repeat protein (TIGR01451 family)
MGFVISMKFFSKFRMVAMLAVALMAIGIRAEALSFGYFLSWSGLPNPVGLNSNLTYTINLTNTGAALPYIYLTNTLDVHSTLVSATITDTSSAGIITTNGNVVAFSIPFDLGEIAQMTVIVQPTAAGLITNTVTLAFSTITNFSTNIINTVFTNAIPVADLAVGMTGPSSQVFSNDYMVYGVNVTNLGPDTAPGIFLTNTLPTNVVYKSVSPAHTRLGIGTNVVFSLGTLASGAFTNLYLTVQPTSAGVMPFASFVNSSRVTDTNLANNSASINVGVSNFFSGQLTAYTNSGQVPNGQVGYLEQTIIVSNTGPTLVAAARVIVSGLTNRLANAVGTNNGNPFVVYSGALDTNQSVSLLLQFYPNRTPFAFGNAQLHPVEVTPLDLTPPANLSSNVNFTGIFQMPSGGMLLEFPTITNRTYTVEYSSNLLSMNWMAVQPAIVAPANYTFWIDYGPPATLSHPTNSAMRFYRVFLNP